MFVNRAAVEQLIIQYNITYIECDLIYVSVGDVNCICVNMCKYD